MGSANKSKGKMVTILLMNLDITHTADVGVNLKPKLMTEATIRKLQNILKLSILPANTRWCNLKRKWASDMESNRSRKNETSTCRGNFHQQLA